jgi:hypothetical protein
MGWKLWLDDQSFDYDAPERKAPDGFIPAVNSEQAKALVFEFGMPDFIDFDHDLGIDRDGEEDTAMKFLRWLESIYNLPYNNPPGYMIHSANGEGAKNIQSFMESWKKVYDRR